MDLQRMNFREINRELKSAEDVKNLGSEALEGEAGTWLADARKVDEPINPEELEIPVPEEIHHDKYDLMTVYRVVESPKWREERDKFRRYLSEEYGSEDFLSLKPDEFISTVSREGITYMRACYKV